VQPHGDRLLRITLRRISRTTSRAPFSLSGGSAICSQPPTPVYSFYRPVIWQACAIKHSRQAHSNTMTWQACSTAESGCRTKDSSSFAWRIHSMIFGAMRVVSGVRSTKDGLLAPQFGHWSWFRERFVVTDALPRIQPDLLSHRTRRRFPIRQYIGTQH